VVAVLTPRHGNTPVIRPNRPRGGWDGPPRLQSPEPRLRLVTVASPAQAPDRLNRFDRQTPVATSAPTLRPVRRPREAPEVYRRRRTVALGLLALVVVGLWLGVHSLLVPSGSTLGSTRSAAVQVWTVKPGDTLWSIALSVHPKGDIRPLADALSAEVHGQPLVVGEPITIP
jgi:hypothetical protein